MIRAVRRMILVVVYAVLGAVAGRVAMDLRQRQLRGEPLEVKLDASTLRPQEIVPGIIAAMRVRDRPWSYLRIPGWFAAFAVNFAVSALGRELRPPDDEEPGSAHTIEGRAAPPPAAAPPPDAPASDAPPGFSPFRD